MMKSSFVIFSHLNLKSINCETTDNWMKHRLLLWEHVCLKSLSSIEDDFLYVVACQDRTSRNHRKIIESLLNTYLPEKHQVIYVPPEKTNYPCRNSGLVLGEIGRNLLLDYMQPDELGFVYTTHLDTDDALPRDFITRHTLVAYDWKEYSYTGFINYRYGYACHTLTNEFYLIRDLDYFVLTYRELYDEFKSVLHVSHSRLHRTAPVIHPNKGTECPMWVKLIHENSIGTYDRWNSKFTKRRVEETPRSHRIIKKRFTINFDRIIQTCS